VIAPAQRPQNDPCQGIIDRFRSARDGELPRTVLVVELSEMTAMMPLAVALGVEISAASAEGVTGSLDHRPDLCTTAGVLHGGALMTLADTVGAVCAFLNLPAGARTSTLESKTNFLRAVTSGRVTAVCTPVHVGRSTIVLQTHVRDEADRLVSLTTQTQTVLASS
jgi:uncharacterized protein (TIGR00369 family)